MAPFQSVVVVGGGLTGLACAYYLKKAGSQVMLLEASEKPGGIIQTVERNGFLFEAGPQCPRFSPRLSRLIHEIAIAGEFLPVDSHAQRYILKGGSLHKFPLSPQAFLATDLVSLRSKMRLVAEPFRSTHPPENEESLADLIRRKFGTDFLDYLVDPAISAVFAGDPETMGVESAFPFLARWERLHGSLLRGAFKSRGAGNRQISTDGPNPRAGKNAGEKLHISESLPPLGSFRKGLATLPEALGRALGNSLRLRAPVHGLYQIATVEDSPAQWRIRLTTGEEIAAEDVVIATPASEASRLLQPAEPGVSSMLAGFSYAPVTTVALAFKRAQVRHPLRGFGLMVPHSEKLNTFYTVWNSSLFPGRAPEGEILITSFAGGARNPDFASRDEETAAQNVESEIGPVLGIEGPAIERFVWNHREALPQFTIGHAARVAAVRQSIGRLPGVFLAGNYFNGRSLGDCVDIAFETAEAVKRGMSLETSKLERTLS